MRKRAGMLLLVMPLVLLVTVVSAAGCRYAGPIQAEKPQGGAQAERIRVVATILPLADVARKVGGKAVEVTCLLPPGASPHTFEPRPGQLQAVSRAQIFLSVGAGLDDWVAKLVESAPGAVHVVATRGMELLAPVEHEHGTGGDGHGHEGAAGDPHVWLDPLAVRDVIAPAICEALVTVDPARADTYRGNLARYQEELSSLDREIRDRVASFRRREIVTFHPAWAYFARRYGLEQVAVLVESPGKEPPARWLGEVADTMRRLRINVVFAEPQFNPALAEAVARELGGRVLFLDPLGGEGIPGRDSYLGLMRYNLGVLAEALAP